MKDGGPAFPMQSQLTANEKGTWFEMSDASLGMSLRDYFAAHAPYINYEDLKSFHKARFPREDFAICEAYAAWEFAFADAMLAEREKQ